MVYEIHALKGAYSPQSIEQAQWCESRSVQGKILAEEPPSREEKGLFLAGCRLRRQNNHVPRRSSQK